MAVPEKKDAKVIVPEVVQDPSSARGEEACLICHVLIHSKSYAYLETDCCGSKLHSFCVRNLTSEDSPGSIDCSKCGATTELWLVAPTAAQGRKRRKWSSLVLFPAPRAIERQESTYGYESPPAVADESDDSDESDEESEEEESSDDAKSVSLGSKTTPEDEDDSSSSDSEYVPGCAYIPENNEVDDIFRAEEEEEEGSDTSTSDSDSAESTEDEKEPKHAK